MSVIYNPYVPINTGNVSVPADFCGLAMHGWPSSGLISGPVNIPNNVQYKNTVTDDWQAQPNGISLAGWCDIETAQGVYDYSNLDKYVAGHAARGVSITYQCLWMPAFYSVNNTQLYNGLNGDGQSHYGTGGPLNVAGKGVGGGLYNFVYNTVLRYKNKGTPLKCWQTWLEPHWPITLGSGTWWGTQQELVDLAYWAYTAAKAADPNIIVVGPSSFDANGYPSTSAWVDFTGAVNTGVAGWQTFDEWGVDLYGVTSPNFSYGVDTNDQKYRLKRPLDVVSWVNILRTGMGAHVKPIAFTNLGASDNVYNLNMATYLLSAPALVRKQWVARSMLAAAAMGVTRCCLWNYDHYAWTSNNTSFYFLDFVNDTLGAVAGFNEIAANVAGKTITFCGYDGGGAMVAIFSDGLTYQI